MTLDFKYFTRKAASDKLLRDKPFNITKNLKYDGYQRGFTSIVYKVFDKNSSGSAVKSKIMLNRELAEEIHNHLLEKFKS